MLLSWAREDAKQFDRLVRRFLDSRPWEVLIQADPKTGHVTYKVGFFDASPRIRKHACHVIADLKHALDQAAQTAFVTITGQTADFYFPFCNSPADLRSRLQKRNCPPDLISVFEHFQPYPRGNGHAGGNDEFCELSKMANSAKHVVALNARPTIVSVKVEGLAEDTVSVPGIPWDAVNHQLTLGTFRANAKEKPKASFTTSIVFRDVPMFETEAAGDVLAEFTRLVGDVISILEEETTRSANRGANAAHSDASHL